MKKLVIACDLDNVILDLLDSWLGWYNVTHNDTVTVADLYDYHLIKCIKPEVGNKIYDFFKGPEGRQRYVNSKPIYPAKYALLDMVESGHEVFIVTATIDGTAQEKFDWVRTHLSFLPMNNLILAHRKELIKADVFIDDAPKNLLAYKQAWPNAFVATIAYPFNLEVKNKVDLFAQSYEDPTAAWAEITEAVYKLAGDGNVGI